MLRHSTKIEYFEGCKCTKPMKFKVVSSKASKITQQKPKSNSETKEITNNIN